MRDSQSIRHLVPATRNVQILFYAVVLGIVVGHVATLYHWAVGGCAELFARGFAVLPAYLFAFMPVAGSIFMILFLVAGRARVREYVPAIIESSIRNTALRVKDGVVCFVTSLITLGSGGSAGPEGPMAYVGATLGEQQGRLLRLDRRHVKVLLAAGT
ncbi:MAG TPA: chloride channel protein, partial [Acidobacteriota bacterium]|nr:chloride channel protein [Acidobacteriota bacterium]